MRFVCLIVYRFSHRSVRSSHTRTVFSAFRFTHTRSLRLITHLRFGYTFHGLLVTRYHFHAVRCAVPFLRACYYTTVAGFPRSISLPVLHLHGSLVMGYGWLVCCLSTFTFSSVLLFPRLVTIYGYRSLTSLPPRSLVLTVGS